MNCELCVIRRATVYLFYKCTYWAHFQYLTLLGTHWCAYFVSFTNFGQLCQGFTGFHLNLISAIKSANYYHSPAPRSYPTQNPWLNFTSKFCLMYKLYLKSVTNFTFTEIHQQPAFRCFQASSQDGSVYVCIYICIYLVLSASSPERRLVSIT